MKKSFIITIDEDSLIGGDCESIADVREYIIKNLELAGITAHFSKTFEVAQ